VLAQRRIARAAQDRAEHGGDEDRVVEMPGDRDEVGDEVERHRDVGEHRAEQELPAARDARVAGQAPEQDDAVRDEARPRAGVATPARHDERADERGVERHQHTDDEPDPADSQRMQF
jgi:hypothetical protein